MKRSFWIMLAVALLLATVWCATAAADDGLTFVQQPTVGALDTDSMKYPVSWETSFKPVRIEIIRKSDEMIYRTLSNAELNKSVTYDFPVYSWGERYFIRAYYYYSYNSYFDYLTEQHIDSEPFELSTDHPSLSFTSQPAVGALDPEALKYPVTWETGFKPVRIEIIRKSDEMIYRTLSRAELNRSVTYDFPAYSWGERYFIRAYYYYFYNSDFDVLSANYIDSKPFELSTEHPLLSFASQPAVGALDPEALKYPVTWETGFKPVRIEIISKSDERIYRTLSDAELNRSATYDFPAYSWGERYFIRAYYYYLYNSDFDIILSANYIDSEPFELSTDHPLLSFTSQPAVGALDPEALKYPVTWETGFKPVRIEIIRRSDESIYRTLSDAELNKSVTYDFPAYSWGESYFIRAYYYYSYNSYFDYLWEKHVDSEPFSLALRTVTFDANGGSGVMSDVTITEDGIYTLPECGFTWENHAFDKWQIGENYYQPGDEVRFTGNTTVRAIWKSYYTVSFNANGGTGSMEPVSLLEGSEYILPENAFTSDTHNFSYWAVSSYPNSRFHAGSRITVPGNITVTAVWVPKVWCTLTFDMNGYGTQVQPITVEQGTVVEEPAKPTSTYRFAYWEVNEGSVVDHWVPFDFDQPVTKSATLRAHWVSNAMRRVKLSYDHEAGTVELSATGMDGECVPVGERVSISITTNPHWSVNYIKVGTLTLNTGVRVFDMPNQDTVYVSVAFTLDHDHTADTMTVFPAVEPTCEEDGRAAYYYCSTCDHYYYNRRVGITDYKTWMENGLEDLDLLTVPALGHEYGAPVYEWTGDYGSVTATCVCGRDDSHVLTETVSTTVTVTKEPGPFTRGEHTYTAVFENPAFSAQSFVLDDIEPLGIPLTEQFFPDANFRAFVSGKYDKDGNGYLSDAERSGRELFQCNNQGIASLRGLEYFPNILRLYANDNPDLTALNLSGFQSLQLVQVLNSPLSSLSVTGCPNLSTLMLKGCSLSQLDLRGIPNLHQLNVIDCAGLRSLDISKNPDLLYLNTYGSGVGYLNIEANPYLLEAYNSTKTVEADYDQYSCDSAYMRVNHGTEFSGQGCIPIDAEHFPDEEFRSLIADSFDTNASGWLSPAEIAAVDAISFEDHDFQTVQGIEYFTALESLCIADASSLHTIDLRANTALTTVDLCHNGLTEIRLDGLTALEELYLYHNGLTALDLSALPALKHVECNNNLLSSLTLGTQPGLKYLCCYGNPGVKALDVRSAPLLEDAVLNGSVSVPDWGDVYEGPLGGTLGVDAGTELITAASVPVDAAHFPDEIFRDYVTDHFDQNTSGWLSPAEIGEAAEITLDCNPGLTSLRGVEYLTALRYLEVDDSPLLESVDLSGSKGLRSVNFYNTGLTALDVDGLSLSFLSCDNAPLAALTLGAQPDLRSLTCYGTELTEIDISGCPHLIEAYHGEKIVDASTNSDNYIKGSYMLAVNSGAAILTGIPEPGLFLPTNLTAIEDEAFSGVGAEAAVIPAGVTAISGDPFAGSAVTTIYGFADSAAETFAAAYGYAFVAIDDAWMAWH